MFGNSWLMWVFVFTGLAGWLGAYWTQRTARVRLQVVRPPRWLSQLCGDPRGDGTVELESAVRQLASLLFILCAPVVYLLGLELHLQAALVFLAYTLVALPALIVVEWMGWRVENRQEKLGRLQRRGLQGSSRN